MFFDFRLTLPTQTMQNTEKLLEIVNAIRLNKGVSKLDALAPQMRLRGDLGFDSLDLAELTVRLEAKFGVDVFADEPVFTVAEVAKKIGSPRDA